jgi:hypothetical protein
MDLHIVSERYAIFFPYSWSPSNAPQTLFTRFAMQKGIKIMHTIFEQIKKIFLSTKKLH